MSRSNPDAVKTSRGRDPDDFSSGSQGVHERPNASGQEHEPSGEERTQASRENTQALMALAASDFHSLAALEVDNQWHTGNLLASPHFYSSYY